MPFLWVGQGTLIGSAEREIEREREAAARPASIEEGICRNDCSINISINMSILSSICINNIIKQINKLIRIKITKTNNYLTLKLAIIRTLFQLNRVQYPKVIIKC